MVSEKMLDNLTGSDTIFNISSIGVCMKTNFVALFVAIVCSSVFAQSTQQPMLCVDQKYQPMSNIKDPDNCKKTKGTWVSKQDYDKRNAQDLENRKSQIASQYCGNVCTAGMSPDACKNARDTCVSRRLKANAAE